MPPRQTLQAKRKNRLQANIRDVGNLPRDFKNVVQSRQIARGDAQHFPLFEQAQIRKRGLYLAPLEHRSQLTLDLAPQPLFLARVFQVSRFQQRR